MGAARRKGKRLGGTPVLGYDVHPATRRLVINHEEAARVRDIFGLYLELGGLVPTLQVLARRGWVNKRWTTKKGAVRGGRPLVKSSLHYLLTNVTYLGRVRYQGQVYPGEHPAIISQDVFQRVQMLLEQSRRVRRLEKANRCPGLLEGLLYCTACDAPMSHTYTSKGRCRYRYYTCSAAQIRGRDDCPAKSIPATELEQFVLGELKAACGNQTNGQLPWDSLTAAGQARALTRLVERVGYDARDGDLYIRLLPAAGQNQS
jgi:site-specific DNA recombinase